MGYVAVKGGGVAIDESLKLLEFQRAVADEAADVREIEGAFAGLIDQVMGESSLYAPRLAALALKQASGEPDEAVFLLRAFRSTLERPYVSLPVDTGAMRVRRRISAAFKDVPGGQVLGATRDYSHRLLEFGLEQEGDAERMEKRRMLERHFGIEHRVQDDACIAADAVGIADVAADADPLGIASSSGGDRVGIFPRVLDYLRAEGLVAPARVDDTPPVDATMVPLSIPAPRSVRLQTLSRGMTQAVEAFGYAAIRGFGPAHPTVGELRAGMVEVAVGHPLEQGSSEDAYYLGSIPVTEVESVFFSEDGNGVDDGTASRQRTDAVSGSSDGDALLFEVGYGLVMGSAETKAIAMSVLDHCLNCGDKRYPTQDEEFVLYHVDGVEATGFISHLKLPHYVTFQSKLSSVRATREEGKVSADAPAV